MKKVYKCCVTISDSDASDFDKRLMKFIGRQQDEGYEVEVQYQTGWNFNINTMKFTALILGYKMEED